MSAVQLLEQHDPGELVRSVIAPSENRCSTCVELEPEWPTDDEAEIAAALAPLLEEAAEARASPSVRRPGPAARRTPALGAGARPVRPPAPRSTRGACAARAASCSAGCHRRTEGAAGPRRRRGSARWDTTSPMDDPDTPDRHINIHFSPERHGRRTTRTSPTSATLTTSSRSRSPVSTTRSRTRRSPASSCRASTSRRSSCAS